MFALWVILWLVAVILKIGVKYWKNNVNVTPVQTQTVASKINKKVIKKF